MADTAFTLDAGMRARLATIHQREADGSLTPHRLRAARDPEVDMGGHGL